MTKTKAEAEGWNLTSACGGTTSQNILTLKVLGYAYVEYEKYYIVTEEPYIGYFVCGGKLRTPLQGSPVYRQGF